MSAFKMNAQCYCISTIIDHTMPEFIVCKGLDKKFVVPHVILCDCILNWGSWRKTLADLVVPVWAAWHTTAREPGEMIGLAHTDLAWQSHVRVALGNKTTPSQDVIIMFVIPEGGPPDRRMFARQVEDYNGWA